MSGENAMNKQTQGSAAPSNADAKNPVLEVKDLCVSYGKVEALTDASLTVGEGQIVTVIGPNGAGKTTMLSAIMGVLGSRGQVAFDGSVEGVPEVERMVARGMTLVGPHRDEMRFEANGMDLGDFGSRGQQRTAVLALKLAQVAWIREQTREEPVLLLDEVLAELDPHRRRCLLTRIGQSDQTIVTTTDINRFEEDFVRNAALFDVAGGVVMQR